MDLDLFHLRQRLTETSGIAELDREAVSLALAQALKQAPSRPAKKRVRELARYLMSNWDGIAALPDYCPADEADRGHMARLLAHRANRELARYAGGGRDFAQEVLRQAVGQEVVDLRPKGEDPAAWLKAAGMPILTGPFASRPFVKYVLRELVSLRRSYIGF